MFVDLHTHSTASDGTDPPRQLIRRAVEAGLSAIALTDHDTVAGCAEAADEAKLLGIDFLCGIEISCDFPRPGIMHMLGYGVDPGSPALRRLIDRMQQSREQRNLHLVEQLNAVGLRITYDEVRQLAAGEEPPGTRPTVVGRPHFARLLARKGYVSHPGAAFRYYLGNEGRFRFDRDSPAPAEAIATIQAAGGLAVLAHPLQLRRENYAQLAAVIKDLADFGLDGVEVIYADHRESFIAELGEMCRRWGLLQTGGSDFHGMAKKWIGLGKAGPRRRVPRELYESLLARLEQRRAA